MVGTSPSNAWGVGLIPGWGARIPYASWPKSQNTNNRGNIVTNSIKTFKMVHIKKKKKQLKKIKPSNSPVGFPDGIFTAAARGSIPDLGIEILQVKKCSQEKKKDKNNNNKNKTPNIWYIKH